MTVLPVGFGQLGSGCLTGCNGLTFCNGRFCIFATCVNINHVVLETAGGLSVLSTIFSSKITTFSQEFSARKKRGT